MIVINVSVVDVVSPYVIYSLIYICRRRVVVSRVDDAGESWPLAVIIHKLMSVIPVHVYALSVPLITHYLLALIQ